MDDDILQKAKDLLIEDDSIDKVEQVQIKIDNFLDVIKEKIIETSVDCDIDKVYDEMKEFMAKFYDVQTLLINSRNESCKKVVELEAKYSQLYKKWQQEQMKAQELQNTNRELSQELQSQNKFSTNMGSVTSNLLCLSSKVSQMVKLWLTEDPKKVGELFVTTSTILASFITYFSDEYPEANCDDFHLVKSLLGTVSNISSITLGRSFMTTHPDGQKLTAQIIQVIHKVPEIPSGITMKKLLISIIYNVSLAQPGLPFLIHHKVYNVIPNCLTDSTLDVDKKLQLKALHLLQSLTFDLKDFSLLELILSSIPRETIEGLTKSDNSHVAKAADEILVNIKKCHEYADTWE
ncbi:uncharacterized protein LOC122851481 isoform X2 [Aphidius gifuensis]|uniref:uncharacterized protein LOC122851481 isoform X2 n=1 Tax=Aphidius gifuensis TaxID=684658 RepID=UPI001CDCF531|nr:uncharacterized protein LOC122851481 isoform X2 [Aphidius gifuensis]